MSISGTAEVGQTLTANTGSLGGSGTITYQWKRGRNTDIGTNSSTYIVQSTDVGSTITITVTRTDYSGSVTSNPTASVAPPLTGTVSISGTAEVGRTLTANTSSLGGSGIITYQWKRGATNIGTNSSTYIVQIADVGSTITVVVARAGYSGSVTSVPTDTIVNAPPMVPTNITATALSTSSIRVSWTEVPNTVGYHIYRNFSPSGTFSLLTTVSSTLFSNTGLSTNTTYYYKVSAYNEIGESSQSATVYATTLGPPNTPTNVTASVGSFSMARLSWSAVTGATSYNIYRANNPNGTFTRLASTTNTTYQASGILDSSGRYDYCYKVSAVNSYGESAMSDWVCARTPWW